MTARTATLSLSSPEETTAFAQRCAGVFGAGDTILLDGPVGAGKTHFARGLIQALLVQPEDVPSPTFTLVQTYEGSDFDIWHTDLYRLTTAEEVIELGLLEAFETALCLVEWPDRLAGLTPPDALTLAIAVPDGDDRRALTLSWTLPKWDPKIRSVLDA